MQDVDQSEDLAKQRVKCEIRAFSCEKYGLILSYNYDQSQYRHPEIRLEPPQNALIFRLVLKWLLRNRHGLDQVRGFAEEVPGFLVV